MSTHLKFFKCSGVFPFSLLEKKNYCINSKILLQQMQSSQTFDKSTYANTSNYGSKTRLQGRGRVGCSAVVAFTKIRVRF